ncbi:MAG: hypothetical protein LBT20_04615 [Clostridiales bacterium]|jgi:hypothetical protein|nr:hypothetical protein [Clostridiales bacterium]
MEKIEGFISDKEIKDDGYIVLKIILGKLGYAYSVSYMDAEPKIYLKSMPSFEDVYSYFMSCRAWLLKINKLQDICLSLLFDPYFNELYERLKSDIDNIHPNRLRFLRKQLLEYLANPINHKRHTYGDAEYSDTKIYLENDMYNRSNEVLKIIADR